MNCDSCRVLRVALELDQYSGAAGDMRGQPGSVQVPIRLLAEVRQAVQAGCPMMQIVEDLRTQLTKALHPEPRVKQFGIGYPGSPSYDDGPEPGP